MNQMPQFQKKPLFQTPETSPMLKTLRLKTNLEVVQDQPDRGTDEDPGPRKTMIHLNWVPRQAPKLQEQLFHLVQELRCHLMKREPS
jgi:hypothetical protein